MPDLIPTKSALAQIAVDNNELIDYLNRQAATLDAKIKKTLANDIIVSEAGLSAELKNELYIGRELDTNFDTQHEKITNLIQETEEEIQENQEQIQAKKTQQRSLKDRSHELENIDETDENLDLDDAKAELEKIPQDLAQLARELNAANEELRQQKIKKTSLENLLQKLNQANQQEQAKITSLQKLHTNLLTDENNKILAIDRDDIKKAKQDLAAIHEETNKLIPKYDARVKDEITQQLANIQTQRTNLITKLETKASEDNVFIDFQEQLAELSAKDGVMPYRRNGNQPFDKDARDLVLKNLKARKSFTHEGHDFYRHPDGSIQAVNNSPASAKITIDLTLMEMKKNKAPLDLVIIKGSEQARNIAAKHALAMGANDVTIDEPDEDGEQWNKIFAVKASLKPTPKDKQIFSATAQSNFALLITELQHHENSDKLIRKVLSALDNKQLNEVMDDLNAAAQDATLHNNDHPTEFFEHVLSLLPKALEGRKPEFVKAVYLGLQTTSKQGQAIYSYINHYQQKTGNRFWAIFNKEKVAQEILKPIELVINRLDQNIYDALYANSNETIKTQLENLRPNNAKFGAVPPDGIAPGAR